MGCFSSKGAKEDHTNGIMSHMVRERKTGAVEDLYETVSPIGRGSVGLITRVRHRQTKVEYALKSIQLERMSPKIAKEMQNEVDILKRLDHPNIIRAIETFQVNDQVHLVMKLCTGGDLRTRAPYSEKPVADIIAKILSATWYMHQEGIVHRDLKLENVMYESKALDADVFVIDYGLSKIKDDRQSCMKEVVGTLYTMAPEVLMGKSYDSSCDMWSIGVMAFILLSGDVPFNFSSKKNLVRSIESGSYEFSGKRWKGISVEARTFIRHLMVKEPSRRYTSEEALQDPWIQRFQSHQPTTSYSPRKLGKMDHDRIVASMKNFASYSKIKKMGLMLVAYRSHPDETKAMREAFKTYDVIQNGRVSRAEFLEVLKAQGYKNEELVGLFDEVDDNHDGHLHYTEFIAATLEVDGKEVSEERLTEAFNLLDMDDSGKISRGNLISFLGRDSQGFDVSKLIAEADYDGSGAISLQEFSRHMHQSGRFTIPGVKSKSVIDTALEDKNIASTQDVVEELEE